LCTNNIIKCKRIVVPLHVLPRLLQHRDALLHEALRDGVARAVAVDLVAHKVLDDGTPCVRSARERWVVVTLELLAKAREVHAPVDSLLGLVACPERDLPTSDEACVRHLDRVCVLRNNTPERELPTSDEACVRHLDRVCVLKKTHTHT
jgi:hypothetical protein